CRLHQAGDGGRDGGAPLRHPGRDLHAGAAPAAEKPAGRRLRSRQPIGRRGVPVPARDRQHRHARLLPLATRPGTARWPGPAAGRRLMINTDLAPLWAEVTTLTEAGELRRLSGAFARFIGTVGDAPAPLMLACVLLSELEGRGHSCLML